MAAQSEYISERSWLGQMSRLFSHINAREILTRLEG